MADALILPLTPACADALAPFGTIIGRASGAPEIPIDYYRGAVRVSVPAPFVSESAVDITLAAMDPRPLEVRYMERHFQHTQAFIPLGGKPFVAVMAPPGEGDLPDLSAARAFLFNGSAGFQMHIGTWHEFPFALQPDTDLIVILSRQTGADLRAKDPATEEAHGPDLDKKDIAARTGRLIRVDLPANLSQPSE
ncbi:ureidoglycolate hydrolase [Novosphingobium sp. FSY-8]|uniref:Ureidoglycolate hydrolase n=1 Tax=Novosphingobium ovatum TaxID=1908523 RepID=A0ABW9X920_9SPHN|nr:ureidoglycolate lyase [Novosphingobium ovatum]NBC35014.1 ureidoglycolate hydrolase [Novosphingobium ovatum]